MGQGTLLQGHTDLFHLLVGEFAGTAGGRTAAQRGHSALFHLPLPSPHALGCDSEHARNLSLGVALVQEFDRTHPSGFCHLRAGQRRNSFCGGGRSVSRGHAAMLTQPNTSCPHN
ncbi:hypothetical protein GCM10007079_16570 [Nocardiopsis terrae]|nr:hypothetical protein GCM10007079_16570 [Nocardiopsis terrae]